VTTWEYARLDYKAAGTLGEDRFMDWTATFHTASGTLRWGTDERYDDISHLNRAGKAGWEAYARGSTHLPAEPHRLLSVVYSLRRRVS
jgi:predicted HicB family RNase H-like nuclease